MTQVQPDITADKRVNRVGCVGQRPPGIHDGLIIVTCLVSEQAQIPQCPALAISIQNLPTNLNVLLEEILKGNPGSALQ